MIVIESDCCDCGLPCIYEACKNYQAVRYICDRCQDETTLYVWGNEQLCFECILEELERVEYDE
jgi:hypothetical protein